MAPMYLYQSPEGDRFEELFDSVDDAPQAIERDGVTFERQFGRPNSPQVREYRNASRQFPRHWGHWDPKIKHDSFGRVVTESKRDRDYVQSMWNDSPAGERTELQHGTD